jgi:hypothetical protein
VNDSSSSPLTVEPFLITWDLTGPNRRQPIPDPDADRDPHELLGEGVIDDRRVERVGRDSEAFPSCLCLVGLQYVNGLGELAGTPGAAAELAENLPGLELGICALAGGAEPGVGAVGLFLGFRLVLPDVRDRRVAASPVALIGQGDQARGLQLGQDAPDPLGFLSCTAPGSAPDTHMMSPIGLAMTCRFIPCFLCSPE